MQYIFWKDSKFWLALFDGLVSLAIYFIGKYGAAGMLDDAKMIIAFIQPIFALIIAGLFQAEAIALRAGIAVRHFVEK
jgi:hypothetical protein